MAHIEATSRITSHVLNDYLRVLSEPVYRQSPLLAEIKARGRETYNHGGKAREWRVRFRRRTAQAGAGNPVSIDFNNVNTKQIASIPWREYDLGESITKYERLTCQGEATLFDIFDDAVREGMEDFLETLRAELFVDGNAAATSESLHGLESWYSVSGTVTGSCAGDPNDTYAGLSTALGNYGGDWNALAGNGWPTGTGDAEYSFFTPLVVDYNNTGLSSESSHDWEHQWQEAIRYGVTYLGLLQSSRPQLCLLNGYLLNVAKNSLKSTERFILTSTAGSNLTNVGFQTLQFEGIEITDDFYVPSAVGYLLNLDKIELCSMQDALIKKTTDEDITTSTTLVAFDSYLNLKCESPAFMGKLQGIS